MSAKSIFRLLCCGSASLQAPARVLFFVLVMLPVYMVAISGNAMAQTAYDLLQAAQSGDITKARASLSAGVSVDIRDGRGRTPLLIATRYNHIGLAAMLMNRGADVNAKDKIQDTPFLYAGAEGRNAILRLILKKGANLKDINRFGGTALIPAAHHGHRETVRILLSTAIEVNHVNQLGWTALLEAILLGNGQSTHIDIVRQLLAAGADPNITDGDRVLPLTHARRRGQSTIVSLLLAKGARE